jgi:sulfotransferase
VHFISGLPRSGSTLLVALLRQNPKFHANISSPVGHIFSSVQKAISAQNEAYSFISDKQREALLKGIFTNFYSYNKLIFDTNRQWCAKISVLAHLFPEAKFICCVRNIAWVLDSFERLVKANPLQLSGMFNFEPSSTVYTRCEALMSGTVGQALNSFKEAFYSQEANRMFVLDYEALVKNPKVALSELYEFIQEPIFVHNFKNVKYSAKEFDRRLGTPGLHDIKGPVKFKERVPYLPPELFKKYNNSFWKDPIQNIGNAMVIT